ncbi:MAG: hypothetical protein U9Q98_12760 [Bacteroidota bacterium]|nr:hypothetical protein [Bacteroidota bacterium]
MQKLVLVLPLFFFILVGCQDTGNDAGTENQDTEQGTENIKQEEKMDVDARACSGTVASCEGMLTATDVYRDFKSYEAEHIQVCGKVTHVCQHGGKRMFLATENEDVVIVTSEEIFSQDLLGKKVVVTGEVEIIEPETQDHEEGDEHIDDAQHKAAHDNTFVLEASKCKVCKCDHEKE